MCLCDPPSGTNKALSACTDPLWLSSRARQLWRNRWSTLSTRPKRLRAGATGEERPGLQRPRNCQQGPRVHEPPWRHPAMMEAVRRRLLGRAATQNGEAGLESLIGMTSAQHPTSCASNHRSLVGMPPARSAKPPAASVPAGRAPWPHRSRRDVREQPQPRWPGLASARSASLQPSQRRTSAAFAPRKEDPEHDKGEDMF